MVSDRTSNRTISGAAIVVEVFSVIFAVLVALGVNEWRTVRDNQALAEDALEYIRLEISSNRSEVIESLDEHRLLESTLESELASRREGTPSSIGFGYSHGVLSSTAWKSTLTTEAVRYLDFEVVKALSEAYELQVVYGEHRNNVFKELGSVSYHRDSGSTSFIKANLVNVKVSINIEESLMTEYDELMMLLEKAAPDS